MSHDSLFSEEAIRLKREEWGGSHTKMLAEEIFAILQKKMKAVLGKTKISSDKDGPALTVKQSGTETNEEGEEEERKPEIRLEGDSPQNSGTIKVEDGRLLFEADETPEDAVGNSNLTDGSSEPSSGGGSSIIRITAGSGSSYTIDVYGDGSSSAATATGQTLVVAGIDEDETIPAGTWWMASEISGTYYTVFPVWGES